MASQYCSAEYFDSRIISEYAGYLIAKRGPDSMDVNYVAITI